MSFKDIKGQDIPISFLEKAIENNTIAHAYLFVGIDGIGKSLAANTFAKALNCEKGMCDSCDICNSCRKMDSKNHPDIFWVIPDEAQKVIKIDAIRSLEEKMSLKSYEAKWKVCIIKDAHFMTEEAAGSLLKILEEPPSNSMFILTTSNISRLLQTIISRCHVVKFSPLSPEIIESILIKKFGFQKETAKLISRLSGGGLNKKTILQGEDFMAWKNKIINEFMSGFFFEDENPLFSGSKAELKEALLVLINWYRDILIIRDKNCIDQTLIINFDRVKDIEIFSKEFSYEEINKQLSNLLDAHLAISQNVNPKLVIGALM